MVFEISRRRVLIVDPAAVMAGVRQRDVGNLQSRHAIGGRQDEIRSLSEPFLIPPVASGRARTSARTTAQIETKYDIRTGKQPQLATDDN